MSWSVDFQIGASSCPAFCHCLCRSKTASSLFSSPAPLARAWGRQLYPVVTRWPENCYTARRYQSYDLSLRAQTSGHAVHRRAVPSPGARHRVAAESSPPGGIARAFVRQRPAGAERKSCESVGNRWPRCARGENSFWASAACAPPNRPAATVRKSPRGSPREASGWKPDPPQRLRNQPRPQSSKIA